MEITDEPRVILPRDEKENRAARNRAKKKRKNKGGCHLPWQVTETNIVSEIYELRVVQKKTAKTERKMKQILLRMEEAGIKVPGKKKEKDVEETSSDSQQSSDVQLSDDLSPRYKISESSSPDGGRSL